MARSFIHHNLWFFAPVLYVNPIYLIRQQWQNCLLASPRGQRRFELICVTHTQTHTYTHTHVDEEAEAVSTNGCNRLTLYSLFCMLYGIKLHGEWCMLHAACRMVYGVWCMSTRTREVNQSLWPWVTTHCRCQEQKSAIRGGGGLWAATWQLISLFALPCAWQDVYKQESAC